jgi:hypothetical protein
MEVSGELHAHGTRWIGGWVGPRAGLDAVEKRDICSGRNRTRTIQLVARQTALNDFGYM